LWLLMQTQPDVDELAELRDAVLQQIDTNRDGKIELGEFARYSVSARTCTRHTTCSHCIGLSTYRPLSAFKTLEVTHVYFRSRTTHRLRNRPQTPPPVLPAGVTFSSRHFLVPIIRPGVMCKHDVIYIQHARCGLVGPDCKK